MRGRAQQLMRGFGYGLLLVFLAVPVFGHARSHSFSHWQPAGDSVRVTFMVTELEWRRAVLASQTTEGAVSLDEALAQGLNLWLGGQPCESGAFEPVPASPGFLRLTAVFTCPGRAADLADLAMELNLFFDPLPDHLHFAKVRFGDQMSEQVLSDGSRRQNLADPGAWATFGSYLVLGVEHILIGIDHLAFLLALLLVCRRAWDVIRLVTGFTVGHSVTLCLAVLGWADANGPVVESLIGFTIALVAVEVWAAGAGGHRRLALGASLSLGAWAVLTLMGGAGLPWLTLVGLALFSGAYLLLVRDEAWAETTRPLLTVCFGLIHGFGFAGVLMDLGPESGRLLASLAGFNLGVEIGQVMVVAVLLLPLSLLWRRPERALIAVRVLALFLCALGVFWFVQRGL